MFNTIEEALNDIKQGKMIIVVDDENRENEGDLVMAADCCRTEDINFRIKNSVLTDHFNLVHLGGCCLQGETKVGDGSVGDQLKLGSPRLHLSQFNGAGNQLMAILHIQHQSI